MADPNIIIALISGAVTLVCTVMTVRNGTAKTQTLIEKNQAVTDTKVEELTREVRAHNNFAMEIPVLKDREDRLEQRVTKLEEKGEN